ncbi:MAG: CDP-6-deoxy-delta-3,4-glucoseen reductase [Gammaproteobacteria bacterium]|nr:CDP-6-deoxy-delta-3,4-glucoseen reductase [Gammaproteobacteria bacterium]
MSFSVKIEPSGHTFTVESAESILDAALRQGINLSYGCRDGACGACLGKVISGEVVYPDEQPVALTETDKAQGKAIFCQAHAQKDLVIESHEVEIEADIPVKTLPCRVNELKRLNHDVMLIKLTLPATERMQFLAGQYIDFLLKDGRHRSFSLANAPHVDEELELHIRHIDDGNFTSEVFDNMKVKDLMRIEGPYGQFFLREESTRPAIFMAGGTGFAPIKGIIEHALAADIQRPFHIYWGVRSTEDLYMHELAQQWADTYDHIDYTPVLSDPSDNPDSFRTGYVHDAIIADYPDLSTYEIYAAGPPAMVYAGRDAFPAHNLDLEHYFSDAFEFNKD